MSSTTHPNHPTPVESTSGRHPVNVGHLVMGIAFLGLVGVWALIQTDVVDGSDVRWLLPVPWVLGGLAGLLAIGLSSSRRWSTRQVGWATAPPPETETISDDEPDLEPDLDGGPEAETTDTQVLETDAQTDTQTDVPTEENDR